MGFSPFVLGVYLLCSCVFVFITCLDDEFVSLIQYRFQRSKMCGIISDGSEYFRHSEFFTQYFNLSFASNFDWAPKYKEKHVIKR